MLLKIIDSNLTNLATSTLTVVLTENDGTTPINVTGQTILPTWFKLQNYTTATPVTVTIDSAAIGTNPTAGEIILTFDGTASVVLGDVLVLSSTNVIPTTPFGRILNTASIDTGLGTIDVDGTDQYTVTPITNSTKNKNYNLRLDFLTEDGTQINPIVIPLATPITVNGLTIGSIVFTNLSGTNTFNADEQFQFNTTFYSSNDGTGEPVIFEGALDDILSVSFMPVP
ncbi:hypothetical protein [Clostridium mediterraneense]|uniref:hypothetical protein n=1 Tax=Clostridium mediterraneense TaxID=1805472 RepID=UPI00083453AA|nr:hypothetical protein [Clostridium mediterraneense]